MNKHITLRRTTTAAGLAVLLALGACASTPPPVAEMATARTSVSSAQGAGALESAPAEFLSAREKLAQAEMASRDKNYAEARRLAEAAAVDAELAERKARATRSMQTAEELRRANGVIANELKRDSKP